MASKVVKGLAIGLAAAGAAAAIYALTGERGKRNRKKLAAWAHSMQKEALTKIKEMKVVSEETYNELVDTLKAKYQAMRNMDPQEVAIMAMQLKKHWPAIKRSLSSTAKPAAKTATTKKRKATARKA
jgi:hypothetical protein